MIRQIYVSSATCLALVMCGMTACSSDSGSGNALATAAPASSTPYSIKLFAQSGGQRTTLKFGPIETHRPTVATASIVVGQQDKSAGIRAASDGTSGQQAAVGISPPATIGPADAQTVVVAAAAQCGMVGNVGDTVTGTIATKATADQATYAELYQQFKNHQSIVNQVARNFTWDTVQPPALNVARDFVAHKARYVIVRSARRLARGSRYDYLLSDHLCELV
jgi:hypothetical protein